jgi:ribosomal protein S17E
MKTELNKNEKLSTEQEATPIANVLLGDVFSNPYLMPSEYKGEHTKNGGLTKFQPRKWTEKEIEWVNMLKAKGFNTKQIAECIDRDVTQVSIKIKRLGKKLMTYNQGHFEEKFAVNYDFVKEIKPKSVLDVFAGYASVYKKLNCDNVISNDKNEKSNTEYHLEALDFVCQMYIDKRKFDLVDLDPFGSAYDCFDLAIKMAKKGLVITLGELGHKRFKRLDFVRRYYGIETLEDFTTDNLVKHIIKIGERNKKTLIPIYVKDWRNIARVYFKIEQLKITEQWETKS